MRFALTTIETAHQEIRKSRFIALAAPISDEAAAKEFISQHSDPSANHNCWAWRIGQAYRFNDDGEPSGTAGKPILQAIDGQSLDGVVVVVIRWFGGILLGSGGLIRAYGGTAALCLRDAAKVPLVEKLAARIICPFSDLAVVQARLGGVADTRIVDQTFTATGAELLISVAKARAPDLFRMLTDVTGGRITITHEE
ncbi:YigZ family protein [Aureimonas fodinaquatilis]|uniref:YigZ family protein n=1 Tax=Aureimonas fodinaquatilis TaxID=2565783 RepID=A0A5B0DTE9_9HYPH|nr:YigZ family protein [Aureimonas fodinaquatilis]KAA0969041.1 YigZ family protein [Aureimonas fodinaquatilis]